MKEKNKLETNTQDGKVTFPAIELCMVGFLSKKGKLVNKVVSCVESLLTTGLTKTTSTEEILMTIGLYVQNVTKITILKMGMLSHLREENIAKLLRKKSAKLLRKKVSHHNYIKNNLGFQLP